MKKTIALVLAMTSIFFALPIASNVYATIPPPITRIGGSNRYLTAVNISSAGWSSANTVVLANRTNFADGLAGAPLAKALDAPILLTAGGATLESVVANKIDELGAQNIVILGGDSSVSNAIETALNATQDITSVERLSGANRYATAAAIAQKMDTVRGAAPSAVFVADGTDFPDGLAAGAAAAVLDAPLLFTHKGDPDGNLHVDTAAYLNGLSTAPANGYAVGGTGSVPAVAYDQLNGYVATASRYSGGSRYETALSVDDAFSGSFDNTAVCFALGTSFPDALAGSAFAAKLNAPLILVSNYNLEIPNSSTTVQNFTTQGYTCGYGHASCLNISAPDVGNAYVFGGPSTPATSISVSPATVTVYVGGTTQTLTATQSPANANSGVAWSSNSANVTVSATGVITGVSAGTAKVTATAVDCGRSAECTVTVVFVPVTSVSLRITKLSVGAGASGAVQLIADVLPTNASNKTLTWTSSSTAVATVSSSGVVTGIASTHHKTIVLGKDVYDCDTLATITVRANDGSQKSATCAVSVYPSVEHGENHQKNITNYLNGTTLLDNVNYRNLTTAKERFLFVAATQVGYHSGTVSQYCHIPSFSTAKPSGWTKYASYYNSGIQYDSEVSWCASFVSWCAEIAGVSNIYRNRQAQTMWENTGTHVAKTAATSSNVSTGDLMFLTNNDKYTGIYHVGIVRENYTGSGTVYTVDGNTQGGYVANGSRALSAPETFGFSHITY